MESGIPRRTITLNGRKTSVSVENAFWTGLKEIAAERGVPRGAVVAEIAAGTDAANLSAGIRVYVLEHFQRRASSQT